MDNDTVTLLAGIPEGRMLRVRILETGLRTGLSYETAAAKARVGKTTATGWAARLGIRKRELAAETPDMRRARHASWALALAELGRMDEAAAWEGETRRLETTLRRIGDRAADTEATSAPPPEDLVFLNRVAGVLGDGAGRIAAWFAMFKYYSTLRELGGCPGADGQVTWPEGLPPEVPPTPEWLPCDPWAVEDEEVWEREVGAGMRRI